MQEYTLKTSVSGRYLLQLPLHAGTASLLVGFHGYGQTAEDELALLRAIPGSGSWLCCSIEALHPVYTPRGEPGASWMTSRQREQRIAENVHYIDAVIKRVRESCPVNDTLCCHGFSQGCGMASRTALLGFHRACGLMLLGGDIPPELSVHGCVSKVHLARGNGDRLYTLEQFVHDRARISEAGISFASTLFTGDHGANEEYFKAAGEFLVKL
jgi:predicted esterase